MRNLAVKKTPRKLEDSLKLAKEKQIGYQKFRRTMQIRVTAK